MNIVEGHNLSNYNEINLNTKIEKNHIFAGEKDSFYILKHNCLILKRKCSEEKISEKDRNKYKIMN